MNNSSTAYPFSMNDNTNVRKYDNMDVEIPVTKSRADNTKGSHHRVTTASSSSSSSSAASGRIPTAQSTKTTSNTVPERIVLAIVENRGREVGIAMLDLAAMHRIELLQLSDNQSYGLTKQFIELVRPSEILCCRNQADRILIKKIIQLFSVEHHPDGAEIKFLARPHFDEQRGRVYMRNLAATNVASSVKTSTTTSTSSSSIANTNAPNVTPATISTDADIEGTDKYLAFASLSALLRYIEFIQHTTFVTGSVHFVWRTGEGRMALDGETIRNLEIITGIRSGKVSDSLYGVINHTKTTVGSRLLRANLISPIRSLATLTLRQDAVDDLLRNESAYLTLNNQLLPKLLDLDHILGQFSFIPKVHTPRTARNAIATVIALKHNLEFAPLLATALTGTNNMLLSTIRANFTMPELQKLRTTIEEIITEDTTWSKSIMVMRQQECFAVRPGTDGNLDAMRTVYSDTIEKIHELAEEYRTAWNIPALKLNFNTSRGYHLTLPSSINLDMLAQGANDEHKPIQPVKGKANIAFTTELLAAMNDRIKESLMNIYTITNTIIQTLLDRIRKNMVPLFRMAESVALLDMLVSFVTTVITATDPDTYCRPTFADDGPLVILEGRHPIVERLAPTTYVPNDLVLTPSSNLQILTGPNCSGKSTFLRQTALITILAHIGSYVPARQAHFRLIDRICTRLGTSDDMEMNASTFLKEMKETAFLLAHGTDSSLVLIDELGRGTSNEDGVGIAWAVCESLLCHNTYGIVITHYHELAALSSLYPNVNDASMDVETKDDASGLTFKYKVVPGSSPYKTDYGIQLAEMCGLPSALIQDAKNIKEILKASSRPGTSILLHRPGGTTVDNHESDGTNHSNVMVSMGIVDSKESESTHRIRLARNLIDKVESHIQQYYDTATEGTSKDYDRLNLPVYAYLRPSIQELRDTYGSTLYAGQFDGSGNVLRMEDELARSSIQRYAVKESRSRSVTEQGSSSKCTTNSSQPGRSPSTGNNDDDNVPIPMDPPYPSVANSYNDAEDEDDFVPIGLMNSVYQDQGTEFHDTTTIHSKTIIHVPTDTNTSTMNTSYTQRTPFLRNTTEEFLVPSSHSGSNSTTIIVPREIPIVPTATTMNDNSIIDVESGALQRQQEYTKPTTPVNSSSVVTKPDPSIRRTNIYNGNNFRSSNSNDQENVSNSGSTLKSDSIPVEVSKNELLSNYTNGTATTLSTSRAPNPPAQQPAEWMSALNGLF